MDALKTLGTWRRLREMLDRATFLVLPREGGDAARMNQLLREELPELPTECFTFVPMPDVPVSASRVRDVLCRGEDPAPLLPPLVTTFLTRYDPYGALKGEVL
jgi:nicotinic acid mononucleotide adenylyltransferase